MAIPKAPDILRPDLIEKYKQQMTAAVAKLNKFVEQPWKVIAYTDEGPRFKTTQRNSEPFTGQIIVQLIDVNQPIFGYVVSATVQRVTVCLIDEDLSHDRVLYEQTHHIFKCSSFLRTLLFSTMKIEDFIALVDEKVKEERNLDKRAKITNRELRQMKDDIRMLKRDMSKLLKERKEEQEGRELTRHMLMNFEFNRPNNNNFSPSPDELNF